MQLQSNWLGHRPAVHKFRQSSNGKVFNRSEKMNLIMNERLAKEKDAMRKELVMEARAKAQAEIDQRQKGFQRTQILIDNPSAKIRHTKAGEAFIQPRVNGSFGTKIAL